MDGSNVVSTKGFPEPSVVVRDEVCFRVGVVINSISIDQSAFKRLLKPRGDSSMTQSVGKLATRKYVLSSLV
jgi:hypothetical protein